MEFQPKRLSYLPTSISISHRVICLTDTSTHSLHSEKGFRTVLCDLTYFKLRIYYNNCGDGFRYNSVPKLLILQLLYIIIIITITITIIVRTTAITVIVICRTKIPHGNRAVTRTLIFDSPEVCIS